MIKYSHRGLVQSTNGINKISLFNLLYITSFLSWSLGFYVISIIRAMAFEEMTLQPDRVRVKTGIGLVFLLAFALMFLNVQYNKKKRPIIPKTQHNVVTFDQSFILYILFFLSDWIFKYVRENKNDIAIFIFIFKLIFFHCFVPYMILRKLKLSMPILFSKNKIEKVAFFMSGWSYTPRHQILLPLKPFTSRARWGSEIKFQFLLQNLPVIIHSENCVPTVEC